MTVLALVVFLALSAAFAGGLWLGCYFAKCAAGDEIEAERAWRVRADRDARHAERRAAVAERNASECRRRDRLRSMHGDASRN